mmetsp:Transcript_96779/g.182039  ORF Transcript_96779/g.182039 Transcript_96779/m.182039 type:complete len:111 (+) Transcript_96779:1-333(+)
MIPRLKLLGLAILATPGKWRMMNIFDHTLGEGSWTGTPTCTCEVMGVFSCIGTPTKPRALTADLPWTGTPTTVIGVLASGVSTPDIAPVGTPDTPTPEIAPVGSPSGTPT